MQFHFEPEDPLHCDPSTIVLVGPDPDPISPHRTPTVKLGRIFDRGDFFEGVIYGLKGHAIGDTQEDVKLQMLRATPMLYGENASLGEAA